jgi:hypothetical protein
MSSEPAPRRGFLGVHWSRPAILALPKSAAHVGQSTSSEAATESANCVDFRRRSGSSKKRVHQRPSDSSLVSGGALGHKNGPNFSHFSEVAHGCPSRRGVSRLKPPGGRSGTRADGGTGPSSPLLDSPFLTDKRRGDGFRVRADRNARPTGRQEDQ